MNYGSDPPINEHGRAVDCWNLGSVFTPNDLDDVSPDHLMIGGAAMPGAGLPAGPHELCYTMKFAIPPEQEAVENGICIVPYVYPPSGTWTFTDGQGGFPPCFNGQEVESETNPIADPVCFDVVRPVCGDADASGFVNITDCVYLLVYIFGGGPEPMPYIAGDVDCNGFVNISDAVYIRSYIFSGGPEPCAACP
jgi:hypothetical protein